MLQTVSSLEPLEEVSYYPRGDGLADIRIRRNITTVMHEDGVQASKSDSQRLAGLEASSLDQDEALAEIYQLLSGGEA